MSSICGSSSLGACTGSRAARMTAVTGRRGRLRVAGRAVGMLAVVCAMFVVVPAPRAFAHGPTPDATNYRSAVTDVVDRDGAPARLQDVIWTVLGGDGLLQVCTAGDAEVVVAGYNAESYLRVGPDGVFENRNSPAVYLNADRYGNVTVPPDIDPSAAPDWRRIADDRQWQWHDHRIHWMAPTPRPPSAHVPVSNRRC